MTIMAFVCPASIIALGFAAFNFMVVRKLDEGTDRMQEIASAIRTGANAFINYEYKIISIVALAIAAALAFFVAW
mgnify:CR=1 FL=1